MMSSLALTALLAWPAAAGTVKDCSRLEAFPSSPVGQGDAGLSFEVFRDAKLGVHMVRFSPGKQQPPHEAATETLRVAVTPGRLRRLGKGGGDDRSIAPGDLAHDAPGRKRAGFGVGRVPFTEMWVTAPPAAPRRLTPAQIAELGAESPFLPAGPARARLARAKGALKQETLAQGARLGASLLSLLGTASLQAPAGGRLILVGLSGPLTVTDGSGRVHRLGPRLLFISDPGEALRLEAGPKGYEGVLVRVAP